MRGNCGSRRCDTDGIPTTRFRAEPRPYATSRSTRPERLPVPGRAAGSAHLLQVAITIAPLSTAHLLCVPGCTTKQFGCPPFQEVQKPSLLSFQVPTPLAPPLPSGSRTTLPSELN